MAEGADPSEQDDALARAREVQLRMLPQLPDIPGVDLHAHYAPAEEIGGDFYDLVAIGPYELGIVVGDVSGHGVHAALVMAAAKKAIQVHCQGRSSPREVLALVAESVSRELPPGVFFSCFLGVLDLRTGTLRYVRAGHPPPLIVAPDRHPRVRELRATGAAIGVGNPAQVTAALAEATVALEPGDVLLCYTDGLTEAPDSERRQYSDERLSATLAGEPAATAGDVVRQVLDDLDAFRGPVALDDDVTLLALRWAPDPDAPPAPLRMLGVAPNNLPAPSSTFIGRDRERETLGTWLREGAGPVTVSGTGGSGKSRLTLQVAHELLDHFPGGCWLADCSEARTVEEVAAVVAEAFGAPLVADEAPSDTIGNLLAWRRPLLLVLDGFEQAAEASAGAVGRWQQAAPKAQICATSRALLGLEGERELVCGPLGLPGPGDTTTEAVGATESVRLFCDRARQVRPEFALDDDSAHDTATLCRALDGLPLAIELAAARVGVLQPSEMVEMLGQRFELLQSTRRDVPDRQRTLLGAIDWSYELLAPEARGAFQQLSVFRGGFLREAAAAVLDLGAEATLRLLQGLREKSLLRTSDTPYGTRFALDGSLREYAGRRWLDEAPEAQQAGLGARHTGFYLECAETWSGRIRSVDGPEALDRLAADTDNCFAVHDRALAARNPVLAARIALALAPVLAMRGPMDQRVARLERTLEVFEEVDPAMDPEGRAVRVRLLTALSAACHAVSEWDWAKAHSDAACSLAAPLDRHRARALALRQRGVVPLHRGDYDEAERWLTMSGNLAVRIGDEHLSARLDADHALLSLLRGSVDEAIEMLDRAEAGARAAGDLLLLGKVVGNRGLAVAERIDFDAALACYAEAEQIAVRLGDESRVAINLANRGNALAEGGDLDGALAAYSRAEAIDRRHGRRAAVARHLGNRSVVLARQGNVTDALARCEEGMAAQRALGSKLDIAISCIHRGWLFCEVERPDDARADLVEAELLWKELGGAPPAHTLLILTARARAEWMLGNDAIARQLVSEALRHAKVHGLSDQHADPDVRTRIVALGELEEALF